MAIVSRLLSARAQERGDALAFLSGADERALTWRAVAEHAAHWRHEVAPGSRVGLVIADPLTFTAAYLGCLSAGLTAAPIDPRLTAPELAEVLARLRVDVLATDQEEPVISADLDIVAVDLAGPRRIWSATTANRPSDGAALRPAVLLTSSGTTGRPKGVPLTEWQLMHAAGRVARHHRFGPGERGYTPLPLFHVNAQVMGLLATVAGGASLVIDRRFETDEYWSRVERHSPTWLNAVPAILTSLAQRPAPPAHVVDRVRFARSASAPLPPGTALAFTERTGLGVLETYGMSEAAGQITSNPLDPRLRRAGSVGLPVEVELIVAGPDGREARPGEEGEVLLRGPQIVGEYLELDADGPERTRSARTAEGWLRTGDVGVRDEAGFLRLAGRADDVINRGGEKIYPQEVENVLLAHPGVAAVAVVGAPHERLGQVPVAFVTTRRSDPEELKESLRAWCEQRLTRYKRPTVVEVTDALPVGPTGKVLRRALRSELAGSQ
ncbi:AMP-binding protein [Amycolatopsis acidiphila]|uniref:AMP-binding protein n=1 Tax=Amycolatopsis acidiphila TaxID=715473 RepID=A0A557ZSV4_9PSEU|nr:AMP-binding protein [Amycolatopsis acidiphila]TVT15070.1 AMP-binding protein [Amycolatopsis acidiphila]UIJ56829.1 AMP-binding protein [Amycolatopsis acidiphila]GHG54898.1 AMP-dependent ligase [Amycolatopsis acidiphila]